MFLCGTWAQVLEAYDLSEKSDVPWYNPIDKDRSPWTLENFRTTNIGRMITHYMARAHGGRPAAIEALPGVLWGWQGGDALNDRPGAVSVRSCQ